MSISSKAELFEKLVSRTEKLGHQVSFSEMKEDPEMPDPNLYAYHYGSFSEAAREAYRFVMHSSKNGPKRAVAKGINPSPKLAPHNNFKPHLD